MKKFSSLPRLALLLALLLPGSFLHRAAAQTPGVGIGTTAPNASAALDVVSSTKGALLPRLAASARLGIATPAPGLIVYQTDSPTAGTGSGTKAGFYYNSGTAAAPAWLRLTDANGVSYDPSTGLQVGPAVAGTTVTGTTTNSNGPFRGDSQSARTETLYSAAYLTALGLRAGPLTGISYSFTSKASTQAYSNFTLALANAAATTLGSTFTAAGFTQVFSGSVTTPSSGVLTLAFNGSAFSWDGTSSVLVQTCFLNASTSGADALLGDAATGTRIFSAGASQCAAATGTASTARPAVAFVQPTGAYALPATRGTAGQVLTQQAAGVVAFQDPQWTQNGTNLYPQALSSKVGIGTSTPAEALDVTGGNIKISTANKGIVFNDGSTQTSANRALSISGQDLTLGGTGGNTITLPSYTAPNLTGDVTSVGSVTTYATNVPNNKGGAGTLTGLLKATGGTVATAVAGTDYAAATGSGSYIQNGSSVQSGANFNVSGAGTVGSNLSVGGNLNVDTFHDLLLRDSNIGLGYYGAATGRYWGPEAVDGPVLYGFSGGRLGTRTASTATTALAWTSAGYVGLGISSPAARLHVRGAGIAYPATTGATQSVGHIARFQTSDNAILDLGGNSSLGMWLQSTNAADLTLNYPLFLNPNGGNVGIGTTNPGQKLDVVGNAAISGTTAVGGLLTANGGATITGPVRLASLGAGQVTSAADGTLSVTAAPDGTSFIQNGTTVQTADFNVSGTGTVGTSLSVGKATAANASAALDVVSSSKGALLPRLTASARLGIATPAAGLIAYQTDSPVSGTGSGTKAGFWYNSGSAAPAWLRLTDANGGLSYDASTGLQVGPGTVGTATAGTVGGTSITSNLERFPGYCT